MSIFSDRIEPDPETRQVGLAFNGACMALALLETFRPSVLAGLACILAPFVALAIAWMDERFCIFSELRSPQADLGGFALPLLALALWTTTQQLIVDPTGPLIAGAVLAALLCAALIKSHLAARRVHLLGGLIGVCLAWGWGVLIYVNVTFDGSPPAVLSGTAVTYRHRGCHCGVQVEYAGRPHMLESCGEGVRPGDSTLVEVKQGVFGWPYLRLRNTAETDGRIVSGRLATRASTLAPGA